mgnify:CR=1 FL=1
MSKIYNSYLKKEINQLLAILVLLTIVFQIMCCIFCLVLFTKQLDTTKDAAISTLSSTIERERDELNKLVSSMTNKQELIKFVDDPQIAENRVEIMDHLYTMQNFNTGVLYSTIFDLYGQQHDIMKNLSANKQNIINKIYNNDVRQRTFEKETTFFFFDVPDNPYKEIYLMAFSPIFKYDYEDVSSYKIGDLCIIKQINSDTIVPDNDIFANSEIYLTDSYNNKMIVFSRGTKESGKVFSIKIDETKIIGTNWFISGNIRKQASINYITAILIVLLLETFLMIILLLIFMHRVKVNIILPIISINKYIKNLMFINVYQPLKINANNDIMYLANEINIMVLRNKKLANDAMINQEKMYEYEMREKNITLYALANQVNPHFLYNIFELIRSIAVVYDISELETIAMNISHIMRYNLRENDHIKISDELMIVYKYIEIMKIRYGDTFDIEYNIEEGIGEISFVKMIFQPLLENCFNHGYYYGKNRFKIKLSVFIKNRKLCIDVWDNGAGIDDEKLRNIREKLKSESGMDTISIGLANVDSRLKLIYGDKYDMDISSQKGAYTKVSINIAKFWGD